MKTRPPFFADREYVSEAAFVSSRSGNVMANARIGAVPGTNANDLRRAGVRSCGSRRERRQSWLRPFRRTRRAIDASFRLIDSCLRVIEAWEKSAEKRPLRATRELERVSGWLVETTALLESGMECLSETTDRIAQSPADAGDAPGLLIEATARWIDAASRLAALSNRLDDTFTGLVDYVKGGTGPLDLSELFEKPGPAPRLITTLRLSVKVLSIESGRIFCIHFRRQRSARLTVADAPRRIFRGRAPPFVSTC